MGVHEATGRGRRLGSWGSRSISPNQVVSQDAYILRSRSLTASRDNPWISRGSTVGVANEIGTGIVPRPNTGNDELDQSLLELWKYYVYEADYVSSLSVYGIQAQASRCRMELGEAFILIKKLKPSRSDLPVPLQFQVLEADFCPIGLNVERLSNGNRIVTGVELNRSGKIVAYWFHKTDPRETYVSYNNASEMTRVPAKDVIHHFKPTRAGQVRSIPEITQALVKSYTFESYNDAELERKNQRAQFTGVISTEFPLNESEWKFSPVDGRPLVSDHADVPMLDLEPGTFPNLLPGEKVELFEGDDAGRGYTDFQKWQLMGVAAGVDIPYQMISGDYADINDRLWRAIFSEFKRETQQTQELYIIPQVCRTMWKEFVDRAIISGQVEVPEGVNKFAVYQCTHRPQAWEYIQPVQDVEADIKKVEAGFKTRAAVVDEMGGDYTVEDVDHQRALDKERETELGLSVDNSETEDGDNDEHTETS